MSGCLLGPASRTKLNARTSVRILGTLLTSLLVCQPALAYEQEIKQLSVQLTAAIAKSGRNTVAVVDFTDLQGNVTELGRFLAEEFSIALSLTAKDFEVIDRTHLKTLLQEHKLAATGIIDAQTARRLGEIAGVQALVTGSIMAFGDTVRLSANVLDTSTAKMIGAATADIPRTNAIDELLARGIGAPNAEATERSERLPNPGRDKAAKAIAVEGHHLLLVLKGCSRSGRTVSCLGSITNKAEKRRQIALVGGMYGNAVDDAGNQYRSVNVSFGREGQVELESDLPVNFSVTVEDVVAAASHINIVVSYFGNYGDEAPMAGMGGAKAAFRDVPIQQK